MVRTDAPVHAVIFDYGGVLTIPGRDAISAWTRAEEIHPETFSAALKEWLSRDASPGTPIHRLETGELPVADFDLALAERLRTTHGGPVRPDGLLARMFAHMTRDAAMLDLVRRVRDSGVRTAMLSNSWGNSYPWHELDGLFDHVLISGEVGLRKPDPRIYRLTLERLGVAARNVVFVDDVRINVEAAGKLGLRTILHRDADTTTAELAALLATPHRSATIEERP